jgi:hypothetical protein
MASEKGTVVVVRVEESEGGREVGKDRDLACDAACLASS